MLIPDLQKQQQMTEQTVKSKINYGLKLFKDKIEDQKEKKTQIADLKI